MKVERKSEQMFTGIEVESTCFKGQRTLFVPVRPSTSVGATNAVKVIEAALSAEATHIYVGANQSIVTFIGAQLAEMLVVQILEGSGLNVTLDIPAACAPAIRISDPRVAIIYSGFVQAKPQHYFKIDARMGGEPGGVWLVDLHKAAVPEVFTPWSAYEADAPLEGNA